MMEYSKPCAGWPGGLTLTGAPATSGSMLMVAPMPGTVVSRGCPRRTHNEIPVP
jgi:hypothetical protein